MKKECIILGNVLGISNEEEAFFHIFLSKKRKHDGECFYRRQLRGSCTSLYPRQSAWTN